MCYFYFFSKFCASKSGVGLSMDAAYTQTFTVIQKDCILIIIFVKTFVECIKLESQRLHKKEGKTWA